MAIADFQAHTLLTQEFETTAERLQDSTVHVRVGRMGGGSGVIWRPDGLIITNAHVARAPRAEIELRDGRTFEGEVIASDPQRDLAALTVNASDLPAVEVADSDALRVGQLVVAVGNPLGLSGALTVGIIHAIAPADTRSRRQAAAGPQTWVQADVGLAPGNSGGPLADVAGRVIGINSMVAGGLGLAVPSNAVTRFLAGREARPILGVITQPVMVPLEQAHIAGLLVLETEPQSPAATAGLIVGDVLIGANGRPFTSAGDLAVALQHTGAGGTLRLDVLHAGRHVVRDVELGAATSGAEAA